MRTSRKRVRVVLAAVLVTALTALTACSSAEQKGDFALSEDNSGGDSGSGGQTSLTLVEQPWVDLQTENEIAKQLLTKLGYSVKIDSVSVELGAQALSTGDADAYLGNWWPSQTPTYADLIKSGKVDVASTLMTGTEYAPAVTGKTAQRLGIRSLADLDKHAAEFGRRIYGIEAGSPGNETIQKAIDKDAYGLGDWKLVESGTPAMLAQVEKFDGQNKPIVFLGWSPHWMTVQFKAVFLEDPQKVWGGAGQIRTVTRSGFAQSAPGVDKLLSNLTFTTDEAGQFYFDHDKGGKDLKTIAANWIAKNPDKVQKFLTGVTTADGQPADASAVNS